MAVSEGAVTVSVAATCSLVILLGILVLTFVNCSTVVAQDAYEAVYSGEAECDETDIRLVGGSSPMDGRVEVCVGGQWGTVCDDFWNQNDAIVVCRQLGFPTGGAQAFKRYYYGDDSGPIHFNDVSCAGNELLLVNCTHNPNHNCMHSQDAGVLCGSAQCAVGQIRLVNGSSPNEGRVEVCYYGVWGTVCDDFWSYLDAMVVCRQLRYSPIGATGVRGTAFGAGSGPIIGTVHCSGSELTLLSCTFNSSNCNHNQDAGVQCHGSITFSSSSSVTLTASTLALSSSSILTTTIIPTSLTTTIIPTSLTTTIIPTSLTTTIISTPIITRVSSTVTTSSVPSTSSTTTTRALTPTLTPTATSVSSTTTKPPTSSIPTLPSPTSSLVTMVTSIPTPSTSRPISTTASIVSTIIPPAMSSSPIGVPPGGQTLSGGAIAGIVIGVIVFVVIIILIGFSMCVVFVRLRNKWIYSYRGYTICPDATQLQVTDRTSGESLL